MASLCTTTTTTTNNNNSNRSHRMHHDDNKNSILVPVLHATGDWPLSRFVMCCLLSSIVFELSCAPVSPNPPKFIVLFEGWSPPLSVNLGELNLRPLTLGFGLTGTVRALPSTRLSWTTCSADPEVQRSSLTWPPTRMAQPACR